MWYEALAAYTPEGLLTRRLVAIRLNGRLVCAAVLPYNEVRMTVGICVCGLAKHATRTEHYGKFDT